MSPRISRTLALLGSLGLFGLGVLLRTRRFSFKGKIVLITGGSRGLGLCLARQFAKRGAKLMLLARNEDELARAAQELREKGAVVHTVAADVRDERAAQDAVAETIATFGRLDVLVNNAGVISVAPLAAVGDVDFSEAMNTHFWGPLRLMNAARPHLRSTRGRIVNISSIGGLVAVPHLAAYSASKFALSGLSDAFRAELASEGIKVTTVFPGLLRTGSHVRAKFKGHHEAEYRWFALSCSTPLTSMNAGRAARKIVAACHHGSPRLVLSMQAKLVHLGHALAPAFSAKLAAFACRRLPSAPAAGGASEIEGSEVHHEFPLTWLTTLADRASKQNNELKPV